MGRVNVLFEGASVGPDILRYGRPAAFFQKNSERREAGGEGRGPGDSFNDGVPERLTLRSFRPLPRPSCHASVVPRTFLTYAQRRQPWKGDKC